MKTNPRTPGAIVAPLQNQLRPGLFRQILGTIGHSQKLHRINWYLDQEIPRIAEESCTSGEALVLILHRLMTDGVVGEDARKDIIPRVSAVIAAAGFEYLTRVGLMTDVADTHNYGLDGGETRNGSEFFFDAASRTYLDFLNDVIRLALSGPPIMGVVGIRFMPRATALLAMQRYRHTVSLEVGMGRARQVEIYKDFWDGVHLAARQYGAIVHWGQEIRQSEPEIAARYGADLTRWRRMLAELSIDQPGIFSTEFSRRHSLEPSATTFATGVPARAMTTQHRR